MKRLSTAALIAAALAGGALLKFGPSAEPAKPVQATRPFGLAGDGKTDDADTLQRAVDSGVGSIHLPKGDYLISNALVVDLNRTGYTSFTGDGTAKIIMSGAGPAIRFIGTHEGTADPKTFKPNVWDRQRTPMVQGIEIVGANESADGIEAEGAMQLTITGVVIRDVRHGIHLVKRNRNVLISDCHIYRNRGIGVFYDHVNLHQSNIVGCHISYCDGGGVVTRGGEVRNVQIGTCDVESCMGADSPSTANILFDSTDGSLAEATIHGCTIQHNDTGKESANIRIIGKGIDLKKAGAAQWGHVTITGNVLSDVQHNIDIENARGVTITGNTFWMAYQYNLRVRDSQQIVVGSNAFERNPAYDYGKSRSCKNALLFKGCNDCTLTGLHIHNVNQVDAALTLDNCRRFNVVGCTILDCDCIGLLANNLVDSRVSDCLIRNDLPDGKRWQPVKTVGGKGDQIDSNLLSP